VDAAYSPPADPTDSEGKPSHVRRNVAAALVAVVVAGAVAGGVFAFRFVRGSADTAVAMAPSDSALYASFNLDPPGSQKMALNDLLNKFPAVSSESQRDTWINLAIDNLGKEAGLTHADVRPWVGPQLAVAAQATALRLSGSTTVRARQAAKWQVVWIHVVDTNARQRARDGGPGQRRAGRVGHREPHGGAGRLRRFRQ
jgi:hypothetical protein